MSFTVGRLFLPKSQNNNEQMTKIGCEDPQRIIPLHTLFSCGKQNKVKKANLGSVMLELSPSPLLLSANISFIESQFLTDNFSRL